MKRGPFIAGAVLASVLGAVCFLFGPEVGCACVVAVLMLAAVVGIVVDEYESRKESIPWNE